MDRPYIIKGGNISSQNKDIVLIVDDNNMMIQALEAILGDEFTLVFARTGRESIKIIKENKALSCVLMDIRLPDISGVEAAREIRTLNAELPIIFHTGHPGNYIEETLVKKEGAFAYITKGDSITQLMKSIRDACRAYREKNHHGSESD